MSVNWNWNKKQGEIIARSTNGKKYKLNLYAANCITAIIYEYKDKETNENMYRFFGFFNDFDHLKRCIGLASYTEYDYNKKKTVRTRNNLYKNEWIKIRVNIAYSRMKKFAELLAEAGFKVELYYKPIPEPKAQKVKLTIED